MIYDIYYIYEIFTIHMIYMIYTYICYIYDISMNKLFVLNSTLLSPIISAGISRIHLAEFHDLLKNLFATSRYIWHFENSQILTVWGRKVGKKILRTYRISRPGGGAGPKCYLRAVPAGTVSSIPRKCSEANRAAMWPSLALPTLAHQRCSFDRLETPMAAIKDTIE